MPAQTSSLRLRASKPLKAQRRPRRIWRGDLPEAPFLSVEWAWRLGLPVYLLPDGTWRFVSELWNIDISTTAPEAVTLRHLLGGKDAK